MPSIVFPDFADKVRFIAGAGWPLSVPETRAGLAADAEAKLTEGGESWSVI